MLNVLEVFRKRGIKKKLIESFILILILPSIAIGWMSYQTAEDNFQKSMMKAADGNVKILNNFISKELKAKEIDAEYFTKTFHQGSYQEGAIDSIHIELDKYRDMHPEVEAIYTGTADGIFIQSPQVQMPEGYNPAERPWYQEAAKNKNKIVITPPYESKTTGNIVVTIARENDDGSGVIGIDLSLNSIVETTKMVNIGEKGYVAIFDANKNVIVHPTLKAAEKSSGEIIERLFEKESGQISYDFEGSDRHTIFQTNEITGWKLAGTMFSEEIDEAAQPIFNNTVMVIIVSLLIGGVLIYFIINSIIKPLKQLVASSKKIS
ncbi:cache domain-containing protein, partial [Bacillus manliponensis]